MATTIQRAAAVPTLTAKGRIRMRAAQPLVRWRVIARREEGAVAALRNGGHGARENA